MHPKGAKKVRFYYSLLWESCGKQAFSQTLKAGHTEGMFSHKIIRDQVNFHCISSKTGIHRMTGHPFG